MTLVHLRATGGAMQRFNPFKPGSVVTPGMFAGRHNELEILNRCLFQTKHGNPEHFLLHGERGIGKSSLLYYTRVTAEGGVPDLDGNTLQFLTIEVELEPNSDYKELIGKVGAGLNRALTDHGGLGSKLKQGWEFLKKWEVMGVKYSEEVAQRSPAELLEELCHNMAAVVERTSGDLDGIVIFIDEADQAPASANLGEFAKILTERLTKLGCHQVCLGIAGVSHVIERMRESHASSPRIFTTIHLAPLTEDERYEVIDKGLAEANRKNAEQVTIDEEAKSWIAVHSEGYPHFIQQYASSAFATNTNGTIDLRDVIIGTFKENGAIYQLGAKYFEHQYFKQIGSDDYRKLLQAMAIHGSEYVSKSRLRKETGLAETTLTNALRALRDRRIILSESGKKGEYCLPTKSFATWIRTFAEEQTKSVAEALRAAGYMNGE